MVVVLVVTLTAFVVSAGLLPSPFRSDGGRSVTESVAHAQECTRSDSIGFAGGAELMSLPDAELDRELDAMRAMGAGWIRVGVDWGVVEATQGVLDWQVPDRVIDHARARGFSVLGVVLGTPAWARNSAASTAPHALPADPNRFGRFAGISAAHYLNKVDTWEIWNEPNIVAFAQPRPDVAWYHAMLVASSREIRAQARDVRIVTGGLSPAGDDGVNIAPTTFLDRLYALGNPTAWDAVGMHPYTYPALPDDPTTAAWNAFQRMGLMRATMNANGDAGTPIWLTEFGAPTGGDPARAVSLDAQTLSVRQVLAHLRNDTRLGPVFIHSSRDRGSDPLDVEDHFGVLNADFSPKPVYDELARATRC